MSVTQVNTRQKIEDLRAKHQPVFDKLGVPDALFIPKLAYRPKIAGVPLEEMHVAFFVSEVEKGQDIYLEFANADYTPQDPANRKLFKWKFNPHYDTECRKVDNPSGTGHRYMIPVSELREIDLVNTHKPGTAAKPVVQADRREDAMSTIRKEDFDIPDPDTDTALSQATLRDLYAVLHGKPVSHKAWLNELINSGVRENGG